MNRVTWIRDCTGAHSHPPSFSLPFALPLPHPFLYLSSVHSHFTLPLFPPSSLSHSHSSTNSPLCFSSLFSLQSSSSSFSSNLPILFPLPHTSSSLPFYFSLLFSLHHSLPPISDPSQSLPSLLLPHFPLKLRLLLHPTSTPQYHLLPCPLSSPPVACPH